MGNELKLTFELVTPLFMHGADPRDAAELRPPSFRGLLRFWYRAALADPNLDRLRDRERAVFGSTNQASPLRLRLSPSAAWPPAAPWDTMRPQPPGLRYLGFAFRPEEETDASQGFPVDAASPPASTGSRTAAHLTDPQRPTFTLRLATGTAPDPGRARQEALAALWLLQALGGAGARSRRGFGSIQAIAMDGAAAPGDLGPAEFVFGGSEPEHLHRHIRRGLQRVRQIVGPAPAAARRPYSMLQPGQPWVLVLNQTWPTWQQCLGSLGSALQQFRQSLNPSERVGFGLPLQGAGNLPVDRRASPLLFKVVRLHGGGGDGGDDGAYAAVVTFLPAQLLPADVLPSDPTARQAVEQRLAAAGRHVAAFYSQLRQSHRGSWPVPLP